MSVLIIGGTGTLGTEIIRQLGPKREVTCLSRCELKQKQLKEQFPHVKCLLGDIRDVESLRRAIAESSLVFHVAALKHIDILEENPEECVKTNILGTSNVASLGVDYGVPVVFSSTDKAVSPVNVYGMSKGISERIMLESGHVCFRWGNVLGSRGSAIHYFVSQIREGKPVNLTHKEMSRFWIRIEDAVSFMLRTHAQASGVMIPPMKAATVKRVIEAIAEICHVKPVIKITGLRPGEKIAESITLDLRSDQAAQYTDAELLELLAPFVEPKKAVAARHVLKEASA